MLDADLNNKGMEFIKTLFNNVNVLYNNIKHHKRNLRLLMIMKNTFNR